MVGSILSFGYCPLNMDACQIFTVAPHSCDTFCSVSTTQYELQDPERVVSFALRALRQGNMTAAYDTASRAILSEIPFMHGHCSTLAGPREEISKECSSNKLTDSNWNTFQKIVQWNTGPTSCPSSQSNPESTPLLSSPCIHRTSMGERGSGKEAAPSGLCSRIAAGRGSPSLRTATQAFLTGNDRHMVSVPLQG